MPGNETEVIMFSFNSKLSAVLIAGVLLCGILMEAFVPGESKKTVVAGETQNTEITELVEFETEIVELAPEYIHALMKYSYSEEEPESETNENNANEESTQDVQTTKNYVIQFSEKDYNNLVRIVEAEATGGDMKAKILVANVVINRVKNPAFPNTITDVIFQGNGQQFSPIKDGRFYKVTIKESSIEAVERALTGEDYSQGATFFAAHRSAGAGTWHGSTLRKLFEYGGHVFFTT